MDALLGWRRSGARELKGKGEWRGRNGACTGYFVWEDGVEDFTFLDLLLLTHISIFLLMGRGAVGLPV